MRHRPDIRKFANCFFCGLVSVQLIIAVPVVAQEKSTGSLATPPALPVAQSPIEYFRELLVLPATERERLINTRSEGQKTILRAKVKEYESMTAEERELRLAVTELRWFLVPLMRTAPENRVERLNRIPEDKRALVEDRLQRWDKLGSDAQSEFLESEMTVNYFLRLQASTPEEQTNLLQTVSSEERKKLESELERWRALPSEDRDRMNERFQEFFELSPAEKEKTLSTLSKAERGQMEKTLANFQSLSVEQRRHCIRSFDKLAGMNASERIQFLRKAEAWEKMSPSDRSAWRELVRKLPQMPPLPPGMNQSPPPLPTPSRR